jgi:C1A family cysteine protease
MAAIAKGPVSVSIATRSKKLRMYTGGVFTDPDCGIAMTHAVLAVGYGSENGQDYYLVKNSWGSDWGLDGYIKIGVGYGYGICGIH